MAPTRKYKSGAQVVNDHHKKEAVQLNQIEDEANEILIEDVHTIEPNQFENENARVTEPDQYENEDEMEEAHKLQNQINMRKVGIVNKSFISSMRKGALLVNIARGGLLNYEDVLYYLNYAHLGGLGIDVAWTEPFDPDDPILKFKNVMITPHVAGVTEYSYRSMSKVMMLPRADS